MDVSIHAPAWGATLLKQSRSSILAVSIHAPAWGATSSHMQRLSVMKCFNPRARVGRDFYRGLMGFIRSLFQSTRPRGARHLLSLLASLASTVSIHAPAWGATPFSLTEVKPGEFQSTRPRGARQLLASYMKDNILFQSTRPRGARQVFCFVQISLYIVSIHAPAWGAT